MSPQPRPLDSPLKLEHIKLKMETKQQSPQGHFLVCESSKNKEIKSSPTKKTVKGNMSLVVETALQTYLRLAHPQTYISFAPSLAESLWTFAEL